MASFPRVRSRCRHAVRAALVCILAVVPLSLVATPARGQQLRLPVGFDGPPPPQAPGVISRDDRGGATVRAVRVAQPITLDGRVDEEVYKTIPAMSGFIQQEPREGEPATERTDAWILFDDDNLYISAVCWDSQPERMISNELRRDNGNITQNENFVVDIDTFLDRRNGFFFETNPLGAVRDGLVVNERDANFDWNAVWDVRATVFEKGWMLEMAIPFKSLRYKGGRDQIWGIVMRRAIKWKNENTFLTLIPASYGGRGIYKFSSAANIVGLEVPAPSLNLEVKPYAIGGSRTDLLAKPAFSNDLNGDFGVDAKYGLTRGLTADFTYNTDFAQVESDDQQVNLTRFTLFYPEKREFFLEGQGLFDFGNAASSGGEGGGAYGTSYTPVVFFTRRIGLSNGETIPIRAGGRVTGRAGPYSVGLLNIETGRSDTAGVDATNFSVVRLRRDILKRSTIGMIATNRSSSGGFNANSNQAIGIDGNIALSQDVEVKGFYTATRTPGRPGASSSYRGLFDFAGDRYGFAYEHLFVGQDFNPEIGFLRRSSFRRNYAMARFSPRPASGPIRKFTYQSSLDYIIGGDGTLESREQQGVFNLNFQNSDTIGVEGTRTYELLRGPFAIAKGVTIPVGGYAFGDLYTYYRLGSQHRLAGTISYRQGSFYDGTKKEIGLGSGRLEITDHLSIEPRMSFSFVDLAGGSFVAKLASARTNWTLTPRMMLAALFQYNSSNDSASANIRFRWEYRPGSDFFVVYTEGRDTALGGVPTLQNRGLMLKMTRLFRM